MSYSNHWCTNLTNTGMFSRRVGISKNLLYTQIPIVRVNGEVFIFIPSLLPSGRGVHQAYQPFLFRAINSVQVTKEVFSKSAFVSIFSSTIIHLLLMLGIFGKILK